MSDQLRFYHEWMLSGRAVRAGQKATHYAVNEELGRRIALFHLDQTEELTQLASSDLGPGWTIVARNDIPRDAKPASIRVGLSDAGSVSVWCGSNKQVLEWLKDAGYAYDRLTCRWVRSGRDPAQVADAFEAAGVTVNREFEHVAA